MVLNRLTDRRRRLLVDTVSPSNESSGASDLPSTGRTKSGPTEFRSYSVGAQRRHQRKTTDMIPKRPLAYTLMVLLALMALGGANGLAWFAPQWSAAIGERGVQSLELWGPGTLASWMASACFLIAAATAWQVLVLRRHRNDDYQGTYRLWGWLTLVMVLASVLCSVDLVGPGMHLFSYLTSISLTQPGWLPVAMLGITVTLLAARVLYEVRRSYGTTAWITIAWLAVLAGMVLPEVSRAWPGALTQLDPQMARGNAMLGAALATMLANFTFARFVFLRANGFIADSVAIAVPNAETGSASTTRRKKKKKARPKLSTVTEQSDDASLDAVDKTSRKTKAATTKRKRSEATTTSSSASNVTTSTSSGSKRRKAKRKTQPELKSAAAETENQTAASTGKTTVETNQSVDSKPVAKSSQPDPPAKQVSSGASEKLKQLAAASRAKQQAKQTAQQADDSDEGPATVKMSKAQRRKQRKEQRKMKRAA